MLTSLHARECFLRLSSDDQLLPCVKARTLDIGQHKTKSDVKLEDYIATSETPIMPKKFVEQAADQAHPTLYAGVTALGIGNDAKIPAPEVDPSIFTTINEAQITRDSVTKISGGTDSLSHSTAVTPEDRKTSVTINSPTNSLQAAMQHQATTQVTNTSYSANQSHRGVNLHDVLSSQSSKSNKKGK